MQNQQEIVTQLINARDLLRVSRLLVIVPLALLRHMMSRFFDGLHCWRQYLTKLEWKVRRTHGVASENPVAESLRGRVRSCCCAGSVSKDHAMRRFAWLLGVTPCSRDNSSLQPCSEFASVADSIASCVPLARGLPPAQPNSPKLRAYSSQIHFTWPHAATRASVCLTTEREV